MSPEREAAAALVERAPGLWTADAPQRFLGMPIGTRMTVVRLPGGGLWLHSPVSLSRVLREQVLQLGRVAFIVAPNLYHHLHAGEWARAFPQAQLLGSPGLADKRPDLPWSGTIPDPAASPWGGALDPLLIEGNPVHREVVFFHRASGALICADLVGNLRELTGLRMQIFGRLNGWGRLGPPRALRFMLRDREAAARCIGQILVWEITQLIPCHGAVADTDSRALACAFGGLLPPARR